jgi:phosphoglycolate phosphatase
LASQAQKISVQAIMLDLDGTLLHTAPEIAGAANQMLQAMRRPTLAKQQIQSFIGEGAQTLIKRCLMGSSASEPDAATLAEAQALFLHYYAGNVSHSQPYPGVVAGLEAMQKAGYRLACVTNKPASFTLPLLQANRLEAYFSVVVSGDSLSKKKPDPAQLLHVCEQFQLAPEQALMVGDSISDVTAARAAGCYVFTVPYGYNHGLVLQSDASIAELSDALTLLH